MRETIRIGALADSHLDEADGLDDNVRVHDVALEAFAEAGVDLILHAGDLHNRKSSPEVRNAADRLLRDAAEIAPVVLVRGNHDQVGDLVGYGNLKAAHRIAVRETLDLFDIETRSGRRVWIQALPWFDKAGVSAMMPAGSSSAVTSEALKATVRSVLEGLADETRTKKDPVVGVAHAMLGASVVGSGQVLIGNPVEVAPEDLLLSGAAVWVVGHVHKAQNFADGRVLYPGSVQRLNFGEPEEKSVSILTLENLDGRWALVEEKRVPLPARRIVRLEVDVTDHQDADAAQAEIRGVLEHEADENVFAGAQVRFRVHARRDQVELVDVEAIERAIYEAGAMRAQVEVRVRAEQATRSATIVELPSLWEKVEEFLRTKSLGVGSGQRERLRSKLEALEAEEVVR